MGFGPKVVCGDCLGAGCNQLRVRVTELEAKVARQAAHITSIEAAHRDKGAAARQAGVFAREHDLKKRLDVAEAACSRQRERQTFGTSRLRKAMALVDDAIFWTERSLSGLSAEIERGEALRQSLESKQARVDCLSVDLDRLRGIQSALRGES